MPNYPDVFGKARDLLGRASARVLSRRGERYHAYRANGLDEDQSYAFGEGFSALDADLRGAFRVPAGGGVLLRLKLSTAGFGLIRDPFVELRAPDGRRLRQYVERGVKGRRFFNASGLAGVDGVTLALSDLSCALEDATWVVSPTSPRQGPLLVLAPHPDDAELAAFGLYADQDAWVVTASAGEVGTHDYGGLFSADRAGSLLRGRMRVAESLSAPVAGGARSERCANLGYFDGTLPGMFLDRTRPARSVGVDSTELGLFRAAGGALQLPERAQATWEGLVADIVYLLQLSGARTVAFPHPRLDQHPDHACLGMAALEALQRVENGPTSILTYAVHATGGGTGASIHPVGARDGVVSLPPGQHGTKLFDGLCSVPLDAAVQKRKALALDTYRDIKDGDGPLPIELLSGQVKHGLREVYRALVVYDLGLVRRFLRPNELFFRLDPGSLAGWTETFSAYLRSRLAAQASAP